MDEMSKIVKTMTRLLYGFILIYGLYVIMHGHLTPGGGFQGGAIVASGFALLLVAYGTTGLRGRLKHSLFSFFESFGAISFISLAFAGIGTTFFYNLLAGSGSLLFGETLPQLGANPGDLNTAGTITLMNLAVGIKVLAGLGTVILLLSYASVEEESQ